MTVWEIPFPLIQRVWQGLQNLTSEVCINVKVMLAAHDFCVSHSYQGFDGQGGSKDSEILCASLLHRHAVHWSKVLKEEYRSKECQYCRRK